jgi:hypothetical protein
MRAAHVCLVTACLGAAVATGCGSAQSSGLSRSTAGALRSQLAAVTADAGRGDRAGALAVLSDVSAQVSRAGAQLSAPQRTALQTGIARVRSRIMATVPSPATTTSATTTTPAAPSTTVSTPTTPATTSAPGPPATTPAPGPPAGPPGHGPGGHGPSGRDHGHRPGHDHGGPAGGGGGGGD